MKSELNAAWRDMAEAFISGTLHSLKQVEPIEPKLAAYLQGCTTDEVRAYFKDNAGIYPLIVTVNDLMYVFDLRPFIEKGRITETTSIKINSIQ